MARVRSFSVAMKMGAGSLAAAALLLGPSSTAGAVNTSANLLKNGTAEAAPGGTGNVVNVPGWTRSTGTKFTAVKYGTPGFPGNASPAPHQRGSNFFAGGPPE